MQLTDPILLLLVMCGPFVGSFLGVLVDRLPRGQDVVWGRSACRRCGTRLAFRDLIPVVSYLWLRGACRHCAGGIAPWVLYLEIAATGGAVLAAMAAPSAGLAWVWAVWLWLLLALAMCDLTRFRLPDPLTLCAFVVALVIAVMPGGIGMQAGLTGALAGAGSFAALRWGYRALRGREGLGLGDVKLMAGLGAWSGVRDLPLLVLIAASCALAVALVPRVLARSRGTKPLALRALPFGAALCGSAGALWLARVLAVPL
ncbi:prepilin peptidase [Thalassobius sp. S69A]|uniref:prepilin peptidase n=1 Tax=unclassified Thalassovita TaxID=2619711 RepID=UPI003C7BFD65